MLLPGATRLPLSTPASLTAQLVETSAPGWLLPTRLPSLAMLSTSSVPEAWKLAHRPATWSSLISASWMALLGLATGASRFWKWTVRHWPATERSTIGRVRLSGRSATFPGANVPPAASGSPVV